MYSEGPAGGAAGPEGRLVRGAPAENPGAPGYEILGKMALPERERQITAIMHQIVTGLRALHAAKLFHRDIKPANVMMHATGGNVTGGARGLRFPRRFARADGIRIRRYPAARDTGTTGRPNRRTISTSAMSALRLRDDGGTKWLILETTDKKFTDTLIERGDIAEFSKDKHGETDRSTGYMVEDVVPGDEKSTIILDNPYKTSFTDEKTQVLFYKKPSARTDLFGVGALMFDMLTLGKSPECFYDYLRPLDRHNPEGSEASAVNALVEKYRAAVNGNTTSAELASILDQVRTNALGALPVVGIHGDRFPVHDVTQQGVVFRIRAEPAEAPGVGHGGPRRARFWVRGGAVESTTSSTAFWRT